MLSDVNAERVYLAWGSTDLRKSIHGLAALVKEGFELDPFVPSLFAFCNRQRDRIKILHWDRNGFRLYYRRLEKSRFKWPQQGAGTVTVTRRELRWLLDGLSQAWRSRGNRQLDHMHADSCPCETGWTAIRCRMP